MSPQPHAGDRRETFQAPKGTHDVLPPASGRWERLIASFAETVGRAGYGLVQQPMFEDVGVFLRMGEGTDVVTKELYDFDDRDKRRLALRPEGTASVVRAYVQHRPQVVPWKVWYATPVFRHERPQAGRYRQHHQLGVEAIGSADPDLDVEAMSLLGDWYRSLGLRQVRLVVNSMGTPADRVAYAARLTEFLRAHADELAEVDREKVETHPLRVLDSKSPQTQAAIEGAPTMLDTLSPDSVAHFDRVQAGLRAVGLDHEVDTRLVRGLDYYTHTLFEFRSDALEAAQNTIGGGGRYDGLVESLGGPPTPGVGFGSGIERVLLTCDAEGVFGGGAAPLDVFVVDVSTERTSALDLTTELRRAGLRADRAFDGRSMKSQMKSADRSGARWVAIVGDDEVAAGTVGLRDLRGETGQRAVGRASLVDEIRSATADDTHTGGPHGA